MLTVDEKSDFVTVTNNLGDNASMVDLQNDSIPPVGQKTLDTSKINETAARVLLFVGLKFMAFVSASI